MTETAPKVIGLIAGGRQFPVLVAQGARAQGHRVVAAVFPGHTDQDVAAHADVSREIKLGKLSKIIDFFKEHGVTHVVMAGTINKRKILDVRHFDLRALKLIFRRKDKGDATLLKAVAQEFEGEGMLVVPPHTFVPGLLTPSGVLTRRQPTDEEWADLRFGFAMAKELGRLDVGQCLVVREGIVAAVEALEGTDEAIDRGCRLGGAGCVVIKVFKPGQEERTDLPSAGAETIARMKQGGAVCLGLEAGRSLLFDRDRCLAEADRAGISVVGLDPESVE